ncbi:MAG: GTP cyclohydrolase I FolE [Spirochaetes bacterium]|nr:GTP cyclohydrolase I FolE [Spirochaetota bacterium]
MARDSASAPFDLKGAAHPLRPDAFVMPDKEKVRLIQEHMREILEILGLDLGDDSLKDTPERVAKMYVEEIFSGLNPANRPRMSLFENRYQFRDMVVEKNITVYSHCEHHFQPFFGHSHVAYIPNKKVIGLSKLNRIVQYYSRRPQVQERLTLQIAEDLRDTLGTEDVAVIIEAQHLCVAARGVEDPHSETFSSHYSGAFKDKSMRDDFLHAVRGSSTHYR